jgi:hypothetical protein
MMEKISASHLVLRRAARARGRVRAPRSSLFFSFLFSSFLH